MNDPSSQLPPALCDALGDVIAQCRRDWRDEMRLMQAEARTELAEARCKVAELRADIAALEWRLQNIREKRGVAE